MADAAGAHRRLRETGFRVRPLVNMQRPVETGGEPGTAAFTPANALSTTATLSLPGIYVLRLAANDSALTGSDDVTVFAKDTAAAWLAMISPKLT